MANVSTFMAIHMLAPVPLLLQHGCIDVYGGDKPLSANESPPGALLGRITRNGGEWLESATANGLVWDDLGGVIAKPAAHVWIFRGWTVGTASWFRIRGAASDLGAFSLAHPRLDGTIQVDSYQGPEGFDFYMPTLQVTPTTNRVINEFAFNLF
ncbi:MAG: hypothetical protein DDT39_00049 [Firmicutes bacterium]|nr:hypothetical protein [candidate division NPL-UPA2 bacterium]